DWVRGVIEPDFAMSRLQLKQAWVALDFDSAFSVRAGQFKKPFSLILLRSSTQLAPIERGVRIRNLNEVLRAQDSTRFARLRGELLIGEEQALLEVMNYSNYDLGAVVEGQQAGFGWSVGVFNGNGPDARDENDGKTVAGRLTYELPLNTPLTLGASFSRRELNWPRAGQLPETRAGTAYMIDAELGGFRRGLWLLAEAVRGDNIVTEETFTGAQAQLSYFHATGGTRRFEGIEPVARVSYGDPDDTVTGDAGTLLTPGINLYMYGRNRLMFNWDFYMPQGAAFSTQHAARAQVNLYF
ncbi:MAG TPA: porin, partial [Longimicrobiales bacterium]|nr:porin [Longimicrobiales bacterium]